MMNSAKTLLLLSVAALMAACTGTKRVEKKPERQHVPMRKTAEIVDSLRANDLSCDWLNIKYDVAVKTPKIDESFKLYVRLRKDSVIWASATYYAVEIARFLLTPDSVKFMDRRNSKYYAGDYDFISDALMLDADFSAVQSLLLANGSAFLSESDEKLRSAKDKGSYYLSFLRKGRYRRAMKKDELRKVPDMSVSLWVDPITFRLDRASVVDFDDDRKLVAEYSDFRPTGNSEYPYQMAVVASSSNEQVTVKTSVSKLSTERASSLSFTIPEKYESLSH